MREILFKAKRVGDCKWVQGQYVNYWHPNIRNATGHFIVEYPGTLHEIYTNTLCQYTGLTDKNGAKIFEGDKLSDKYGDTGVVKFGWSYGACGFVCEGVVDDITDNDLLVIGNIYDKEADHED